MRGLYARHSRQQDSATALRSLEIFGSLLNAHPTGHFAHRCQAREIAVGSPQRFIGQRCDTGHRDISGQFFTGCEVEIREDNLLRSQQRPLGGLRLLDFHNQFGLGPHVLGCCHNRGSIRGIQFICEAAPQSRTRFHQNPMSGAC